MPKWRDVSAGEAVILKGERYEVTKAKLNKKGTKVRVILEGRRGRFDREVDAKLKVERAPAPATGSGSSKPARKVKGDPLHDEDGRQRRWATQGELDAVVAPDPEKLRAPWAKAKGKAEKAVTSVLGATLVGQATDPDVGWYVPPVDPSTIDAHLLLFHDLQPEGDYKTKAKMHEKLHADHLAGPFAPLHVNHWHTKERPEP